MRAPHPTWVEVDLAAVARNCARIIQDLRTPLMAVVKCEAYGHGAVEVARASVRGGASWLGVARYGEARALRQARLSTPTLVLGMAVPDEVDEAIQQQVTLTLHSPETLSLYRARARSAGRPLRVHLKVETGLGRLGVLPDEVVPFARQAVEGEGLVLDGFYSHLALAEEDHPLNALQVERFGAAVRAMEAAGLRPRWVHLANSAAAFGLPGTRHDLVRVGNVGLGMRIRPDRPLPEGYRAALSWKAQLASCRLLPAGWGVGYGQTYVTAREEWVGVVPVGYGDGLPRGEGQEVLVGGRRCPVLGRSCLDQSMIRLAQPFPEGEEVVLIGAQGPESIGIHDLSLLHRTTQVDITSRIHHRVPRIYLQG